MSKKRILSAILTSLVSFNSSLAVPKVRVKGGAKGNKTIINIKAKTKKVLQKSSRNKKNKSKTFLGRNKKKNKSLNKKSTKVTIKNPTVNFKSKSMIPNEKRILSFMPDWAAYVLAASALGLTITIGGYFAWKKFHGKKPQKVVPEKNEENYLFENGPNTKPLIQQNDLNNNNNIEQQPNTEIQSPDNNLVENNNNDKGEIPLPNGLNNGVNDQSIDNVEIKEIPIEEVAILQQGNLLENIKKNLIKQINEKTNLIFYEYKSSNGKKVNFPFVEYEERPGCYLIFFIVEKLDENVDVGTAIKAGRILSYFNVMEERRQISSYCKGIRQCFQGAQVYDKVGDKNFERLSPAIGIKNGLPFEDALKYVVEQVFDREGLTYNGNLDDDFKELIKKFKGIALAAYGKSCLHLANNIHLPLVYYPKS